MSDKTSEISKKYRTWIEVSKLAIEQNYKIFRGLLSDKTKLLAVVKSNAYGHELVGFAQCASSLGADWLGVDSITEAKTLRTHGIKKPILVLGYTLPAHFAFAEKFKISLTVSNFENLNALAATGKKISIHIKADTGMHRQGFFENELRQVCGIIKKSPNIAFEGIYTHFASAKKPDSQNETGKQIAKFQKSISIARSSGFAPLAHASATAGTVNFPQAHFDMVRIGIGLYGLWPSEETEKKLAKKINLRPALSWKAVVSELKWVEKGEKVGYDYSETLRKKTRLGIIPIGYWHGYWRAFSKKSFVLIGGIRCKVVGRVAMDMIAVDATLAAGARVGDTAVLIGKQGKEEITAGELAKIAKTTHYEIVTRLNPLIKKEFI